jgi:hypothetical protein
VDATLPDLWFSEAITNRIEARPRSLSERIAIVGRLLKLFY